MAFRLARSELLLHARSASEPRSLLRQALRVGRGIHATVAWAPSLRVIREQQRYSHFAVRLLSGCSSKSGENGDQKKVAAVTVEPGPPTDGFDVVLHRSSRILVNVGERIMQKLLHVHSEAGLAKYLGDSAAFDMTGCSDIEDAVTKGKAMKQYSESVLADFSKPLPFRDSSFQMVACIYPPERNQPPSPTTQPSSPHNVSLSDMARLLANQGFVLIGAPEQVFHTPGGYMNQLEELNERGELSLLSMQIIDIAPGAAAKTTSSGSGSSGSGSSGKEQHYYYLAVARKS